MKKLKLQVSIGTLKNNLSAYLRKVKVGDAIVITDHNHPVAQIIPYDTHLDELKMIPARTGVALLMEIAAAPHGGKDFQSLQGLTQDRGEE